MSILRPQAARIDFRYVKQRLVDGLWRLDRRVDSIAFLLIECQSTNYPAMAVRLLHSASAVYLALSENSLPEFGYSATRLPLASGATPS